MRDFNVNVCLFNFMVGKVVGFKHLFSVARKKVPCWSMHTAMVILMNLMNLRQKKTQELACSRKQLDLTNPQGLAALQVVMQGC